MRHSTRISAALAEGTEQTRAIARTCKKRKSTHNEKKKKTQCVGLDSMRQTRHVTASIHSRRRRRAFHSLVQANATARNQSPSIMSRQRFRRPLRQRGKRDPSKGAGPGIPHKNLTLCRPSREMKATKKMPSSDVFVPKPSIPSKEN